MRIYESLIGELFTQDHINWKTWDGFKAPTPFSLVVIIKSVPSWQWNMCKWQVILPLGRKKRKPRLTFFLVHLFFSLPLANTFKISFWTLWKASLYNISLHLMNAGNLSLAAAGYINNRNISARIILPFSYSNLLKTSFRKGYSLFLNQKIIFQICLELSFLKCIR